MFQVSLDLSGFTFMILRVDDTGHGKEEICTLCGTSLRRLGCLDEVTMAMEGAWSSSANTHLLTLLPILGLNLAICKLAWNPIGGVRTS